MWHAAALGMLPRLEELFAATPAPGSEDICEAFWQACRGGQRRAAELLLQHGAGARAAAPPCRGGWVWLLGSAGGDQRTEDAGAWPGPPAGAGELGGVVHCEGITAVGAGEHRGGVMAAGEVVDAGRRARRAPNHYFPKGESAPAPATTSLWPSTTAAPGCAYQRERVSARVIVMGRWSVGQGIDAGQPWRPGQR